MNQASYPVVLSFTDKVNRWWESQPFANAVESALKELEDKGPRRILCGCGTAKGVGNITSLDVDIFLSAPIIFIREDGWTLGCHKAARNEAFELWKEEWVAFIEPGTFQNCPRGISEFSEVKSV